MSENSTIRSLAKASHQERHEIFQLTARERRWYAGHPRFATNEDILKAAFKGKLRHVNPDDNLLPIGRLRNPELFPVYPPYLLPESLLALKAIGRLWRSELLEQDMVAPKVRLAVTSLTRSEVTQKNLVEDPTKLASPGSTHCAGAAFDIDAAGYYHIIPDGAASVVDPRRDRQAVQEIGQTLMEKVTQAYIPPETSLDYDPRITDMLVAVTDSLHEAGVINRIVEYQDNATGNRCVHIAPSPDFRLD